MNDENKFASDHSDVESRVFAFRSCMEPALHLFPENIVERLKSDGFFTAPPAPNTMEHTRAVYSSTV